jgi:hypothetical protein
LLPFLKPTGGRRPIIIEMFIEFIDRIYYKGYAKHLADADPEKIRFEFNEFLNNYS